MNTQFCLTPPWQQQMLQPLEKLIDLHSEYRAGFAPSKKKITSDSIPLTHKK